MRQGELNVRVFDANWMQIEEYLSRDDRIVLPTGEVESTSNSEEATG